MKPAELEAKVEQQQDPRRLIVHRGNGRRFGRVWNGQNESGYGFTPHPDSGVLFNPATIQLILELKAGSVRIEDLEIRER